MDYHFSKMLSVLAPNLKIPSMDRLKDESFSQSVSYSKKVLASTAMMPYIAVFSGQHADKDLLLSVSFNKKMNYFYIDAIAIQSNLPDINEKINVFIENSVKIVNGYIEKDRENLYTKI